MQVEKLGAVLVSVPEGEGVGASLDFYERLIGLELGFRDGDRYATVGHGGGTIALAAPPERPAGAAVALSIKVDDIEAWHAHLNSNGVPVGDIVEGGHERRFSATDPAGHEVVLYAAR